jgi:hypothetical protein
VSKFVGKFRERDYDDDNEFFDKKKKKMKPAKSHVSYDYSRLRREEDNYYEKPSRSKSRRAV